MRTNEKTTPIHEWDDVNVKARYFTAGEKMVDVTADTQLPVGWIHSKVRMDLLEFTETFENTGTALDIRVVRLYINDEFIGELFDVKQEQTDHGLLIKCEVIVGYD
jgi:hypothetical protein